MESTNIAVKEQPHNIPTPISIADVKNYLCPKATDKEIVMFVKLCQSQNLNPWIKEAYLIKYSDSPATMVVGKDVFTKRAQANPRFRGFEAGIIVEDKDGVPKPQKGSFKKLEQKLIGGWAKVYVENYQVPIEAHVTMEEYSTGQSSWKKIPATMIRKVALVQALREAFPEELGGLYDAAEMRVDPEKLETVNTVTGEVIEEQKEASPKETEESMMAEKTVDKFIRLCEYLDTIREPNYYLNYIGKGKDGNQPTLQEIKTWRSPKQIGWLHLTMKKMAEDVDLKEFEQMENSHVG